MSFNDQARNVRGSDRKFIFKEYVELIAKGTELG